MKTPTHHFSNWLEMFRFFFSISCQTLFFFKDFLLITMSVQAWVWVGGAERVRENLRLSLCWAWSTMQGSISWPELKPKVGHNWLCHPGAPVQTVFNITLKLLRIKFFIEKIKNHHLVTPNEIVDLGSYHELVLKPLGERLDVGRTSHWRVQAHTIWPVDFLVLLNMGQPKKKKMGQPDLYLMKWCSRRYTIATSYEVVRPRKRNWTLNL